VRVKDIEYTTLINIQAFGAKEAFFEEDAQILVDLSQAILKQEFQLYQRKCMADFDPLDLNQIGVPISTDFEDIEARHHMRFDELAFLARKIYKKLDPQKY